MFGADTPLVIDALQMAAVAVVAGGAGVYLLMRRRRTSTDAASTDAPRRSMDLEERVQVLERIATDRSIDLAEEIEVLREERDRKLEATPQ
ncbi:hypothetical protein [Erythrobacter sp. THAF29]|uniref:hypothetical protein n=1 Tax=Erythrobacter sp. THAF29 TaxID=2587851 RepID=UPI001268F9B2|nr:hypothetical protein [Erythrobacter sp. THAF29]QFT78574.1 hypothetical protein FIU90_13575 [Erythrobacter sp. THAF29]